MYNPLNNLYPYQAPILMYPPEPGYFLVIPSSLVDQVILLIKVFDLLEQVHSVKILVLREHVCFVIVLLIRLKIVRIGK